MSQPFDAAAKALLFSDPTSFLALAGIEVGPGVTISPVAADLASVSAQADAILRVESRHPWLVHIEFQAQPDPRIAERVARYGMLLRYRERLPVLSLVFLLTHQADRPRVSDVYEDWHPGAERPYLRYAYRVVRVYDLPIERLLTGGPGILPLVPLGRVESEEVGEAFRRMDRRLAELAGSEAPAFRSAALILMGLKFPPGSAVRVLGSVPTMINWREESSTYRMIVEEGLAEGLRKGLAKGLEEGLAKGQKEGRADEARRLLLRLGEKRFGPPTPAVTETLNSFADPDHLETLALRIMDVSAWDELLSEPESKPKTRRRTPKKP